MVKILHGLKGNVVVPRGKPGTRMWTRPFFDAFIRKCKKAEVPLNPAYLRKHASGVWNGGVSAYGDFNIAMRRNGIRYEEILLVKPPMSIDEISKAIAKRERTKQSLLTHVVQRDACRLYNSANARYGKNGGWERAVNATGRDYAEIKRKEREARRPLISQAISAARHATIRKEVCSEIKRRSEAGLPITRWFIEKEDKELFKKGKRAYHNDWKAAVKDAGLNYKEALLREWPDLVIKRELHDMQDKHKGLNIADAIAVFKLNPDMYIAAITRHKKWRLALYALGINLTGPRPVITNRFDSSGLEKPVAVIQQELEEAHRRRIGVK